MNKRSAKRKNPTGITLEIILIIAAFMFLYPIFYLILTSFKSPAQINQPLAMPDSLYWGHYEKAIEKVNVLLGLFNTSVISVGSIGLLVIISSMAGYVIARIPRRFFQFLFFFFISGMVIPLQTGMIPIFKMGVALHLIDTRTFMILLYAAGALPMAIFMYSGFTKSIPREIEESAAIDGYGKFRAFWLIIFPLMLPATGTLIMLNIYGIWNDLFGPLLYLKDPSKMTLMSQIVQFKANHQSIDYGPIFALCVMATLPLVVLFIFTQKYMMKGLVAGAIKG
ncbi:carbohydrate ABC transporter permease [Paenibacillus sp. PAMC21692]|uniref:carbohydrate ABC transporter permease n=1 Tax=Paenibacillus sp. PAMC21692 TaxID=2762320 RepID=UPI00164EB874|nr:carbohydrate ABC transporter permease [Paenibacillus sp. PAMC21692]QNK57353.1 carbohydrate ABC transporter permease [Paenibacillus sp. PAMC21692]